MFSQTARAAGFTSPAAAVVGVGGAGGVVPGMDSNTHYVDKISPHPQVDIDLVVKQLPPKTYVASEGS